jgi:hypothetical protein
MHFKGILHINIPPQALQSSEEARLAAEIRSDEFDAKVRFMTSNLPFIKSYGSVRLSDSSTPAVAGCAKAGV